MAWQSKDGEDVYVPAYRIESRGDGFEPQMKYEKGGEEVWLPLNVEGYILEPEVWDYFGPAKITKHVELSEADAQRAVTCARRINGERTLASLSPNVTSVRE